MSFALGLGLGLPFGGRVPEQFYFLDGEQSMGRQMVVFGDSIAGMNAYALTCSGLTLDGSTTMTVSSTSHSMLPGQPIYGFAATDEDLNGRFTVTSVVDANTFTVTLPTAKSGTATAKTGTFQLYNTALLSDRGAFNWLSALNNACFDIAGVCAEAGSLASYLPTLIGKASGLTYQWAGIITGINDAAASATGATIASRITSAVDTLVANGKNVIIATIGPWQGGGTSGYTAAKYQAAMEANAILKRYAARTRGVYIMDTIAAASTATSTAGAPASNMLDGTDNTHPTAKGAYTYAARFTVDYPYVLPTAQLWLPTTAMIDEGVAVAMRQLWNNPLMAGTGGSLQGSPAPSGSAATSQIVYMTGAGAAAVCSLVADASGFGQAQRIALTSSADNDRIQMYSSDGTLDITSGESIRVALRVKCGLSGGGATTQLKRIYAKASGSATGIIAGTKDLTAMLYSSASSVANFPQLNDVTLTLLSPARLINGAVASGLTGLLPEFASHLGGADTVTYDVSRVAAWATS